MDWIHCRPTAPVLHRFTGGPSGLQQTQPPYVNKDPSPVSILTARQGRQVPSMGQLKDFNTRHNRHWLVQRKRIQICVGSTENKETKITFKCWECNIGLCATPCFKVYHTKLHFWRSNDTKMEKWYTQMSVITMTVTAEIIFFRSDFLMK